MRRFRFVDPAIEAEYISSERASQSSAVRTALIFATAISCILFLLVLLESSRSAQTRAMAPGMGILIVCSGFSVLWTRSRVFVRYPAADFVTAGVMTAALLTLLASKLAPVVAKTPTFDPQTLVFVFYYLTVYSILIAVCSGFAFAASPLYRTLWQLITLSSATWFVLTRSQDSRLAATFVINLLLVQIICCYLYWERDARARRLFTTKRLLAAEQKRTEGLLYNVLPEAIAERLKEGETIVDSFSNVTAVFIDVVGFSALAKVLAPQHLLKVLNEFFSAVDRCAERRGVEKVKTIGDAYLAVVGGMASLNGSSTDALKFAHDVIEEVRMIREQTGVPFRVRVGMHTGSVIGGVIGNKRMVYDYWGDTMNIASRIESVAPIDGIAVSEATYYQTLKNERYEPPRDVILKGVGDMKVFFVIPNESSLPGLQPADQEINPSGQLSNLQLARTPSGGGSLIEG